MKHTNLFIAAAAGFVAAKLYKGAGVNGGIGMSSEYWELIAVKDRFALKDDYEKREASKGSQQLQEFFSRRLNNKDYSVADDVEEVESALRNPESNWFVERVDWLLNGTYGSEYMYLCHRILSQMANSEGRFKQNLRAFAINVTNMIAAAELGGLNRAKFVSILNKQPEATERMMRAIENEIVNYYTQYQF